MKSAHPERGIKGQKKAAEHHVKIDWSKIWEGGGGAEQLKDPQDHLRRGNTITHRVRIQLMNDNGQVSPTKP